MGIGRELLRNAGYKKFAATKASKEMFIMNIANVQKQSVEDAISSAKSILDIDVAPYADVFVLASEFNSFVPPGDIDFLMMLTDLWDNLDVYDNPKITSKSVSVEKPTVNILAANTPQMFNNSFPSESVGSGTLSRFMLINGHKTKKKILIGNKPNLALKNELVDILKGIKEIVKGEAHFTPAALKLMQCIYEDYEGIQDTRFEAYNERRIAHLFKLVLIFSAVDLSTEITEEHVINANTQLCAAECGMPLALGHFGRSKSSALMHKIVEFISAHPMGVTNNEIIVALHREINNSNELQGLMKLLHETHQIKVVEDKKLGHVWHVIPSTFPSWAKPYVNYDLLTTQEKEECNIPTEMKLEMPKNAALLTALKQ